MYCKPTARPAMLPRPLLIWPRKPDPLSRARDMDSEKAFMSLAAAFMPKEIIWLMPESPTADLSLSQALAMRWRSEEHTSELQSPCNLVCRLLLEKKKTFQP